MPVADDIRQALYDAIGWQAGLVDAWPAGSPEREEAVAKIEAYRKILRRRYGDGRMPDEKRFDGAKLVGIDEIREMVKADAEKPLHCMQAGDD